eukprot:gene11455-2084_t
MSDMPGVPWDIHTESHHWTSPDGISNWTMGELVFNSSAKQDGSDRRAAIFAPMVIYDPEEIPGLPSHAFPYRVCQDQADIILDEEMGNKAPWEGYQGTDSFHAWQIGNGTWYGWYGSHGGKTPGTNYSGQEWQVGLITAEHLAGPWTRCPWLNPASYIESPEGIENPIVTRMVDKSIVYPYVAVYDALMPDQIHGHTDVVGITQSPDGWNWSPHQYVSLNASSS